MPEADGDELEERGVCLGDCEWLLGCEKAVVVVVVVLCAGGGSGRARGRRES